MFCCFAAPSPATERYIAERVETPFNRDFWARCSFDDPEVAELCARKGITLRTDGVDRWKT